MKKIRPGFEFYLTFNLLGVFVSLALLLSIFRHMPNVTNLYSGIYLFSAVFGYTCLIWLLISVASFFFTKLTKSLVPSSILIAASILFLFLDTRVYSIYRSHLSRGLLDYAINEAFGELKRVGSTALLPFLLGMTFSVGLVWIAQKAFLKKISIKKMWFSKYIYISAAFLFVFSQFTYMYADVINYIPIKKWTRHIPLYQPLTARRALFKYGIVDSSKVRDFEVQTHPGDTSINYPKELTCNKKNSTEKPNILWLFLDTWRFDAFSKSTTPFIYDWVQKNNTHIFQNHWSVGNETIPSLFSMFYGAPGLYIKSFTESGTTPIFISKLLKEEYQLQISTSWPLDNTSLTKNIFRKVPNLRVNTGGKEAWEADLFLETEFSNFLQTRDKKKPYFSFMIMDSAHDYSLPPNYKTPFEPFAKKLNYFALGPASDPTPYHNKYKNSVHYMDSLVKKILSHPLLKDESRPTIILIASDHGEQFNDLKKNFWGHSSNFSRYQLRVPLFINWGGFKSKGNNEIGEEKKSFNHMTTHNDLSHTFLESVFGCQPTSQQSIGKNLYSRESRFPLLLSTYSRHGLLTKDKIYSYEVGQGYEVFDYDYNEVEVDSIPSEVFSLYLKESTRFYN